MVYYHRATRRPRHRVLYAATALVALALGADLVSGGAVRAYVRSGAAAASQAASAAGSGLALDSIFASKRTLEAQNTALAQQVAALSERAARADVLQQENDSLRTLVHLATSTPGTTAPIVSSLNASPYGTFVIGIGVGSAIARGDLVLSPGGFVIGRVSDVGSATALVAEVLAPGASLDARLGTADLTAEGLGDGSGHGVIPRGIDVSVGDTVRAPSLGARPLGIVAAVRASAEDATQDIYFGLPSGLRGIQFVYVTPIE